MLFRALTVPALYTKFPTKNSTSGPASVHHPALRLRLPPPSSPGNVEAFGVGERHMTSLAPADVICQHRCSLAPPSSNNHSLRELSPLSCWYQCQSALIRWAAHAGMAPSPHPLRDLAARWRHARARPGALLHSPKNPGPSSCTPGTLASANTQRDRGRSARAGTPPAHGSSSFGTLEARDAPADVGLCDGESLTMMAPGGSEKRRAR